MGTRGDRCRSRFLADDHADGGQILATLVMHFALARCDVRSWRRSDADPLARHANNRHIWINLRDRFPHPYTKTDAWAFIRWAREQRPETAFAIAVNDEAV